MLFGRGRVVNYYWSRCKQFWVLFVLYYMKHMFKWQCWTPRWQGSVLEITRDGTVGDRTTRRQLGLCVFTSWHVSVVQQNTMTRNSSGPWKSVPYNQSSLQTYIVNYSLVNIREWKSVPYNRRFLLSDLYCSSMSWDVIGQAYHVYDDLFVGLVCVGHPLLKAVYGVCEQPLRVVGLFNSYLGGWLINRGASRLIGFWLRR